MLSFMEGKRRFGVSLAMRHRLSGIPTYGLNGLSKGDEHIEHLAYNTFTFICAAKMMFRYLVRPPMVLLISQGTLVSFLDTDQDPLNS